MKFRKDRKQNLGNKKFREYFYWGVEFAIVLRQDDIQILKLIKDELDCGSITHASNGTQVRYSVQNTKDLAEKIVPFFKQYKLRAKKAADFDLWGQAEEILNKHKNGVLNIKTGIRGFVKKELSKEDEEKLTNLRNKMLDYKSNRSKDFRWGS